MSKFVLSTVYTFFVFFICYCYPAQELTTEAENLAESVYACEWYNFPEFQKDVLILLGKSRIKVAFNMGGILDLNLETGMAAVKAILSYSMFLRTMTLLEGS
ncbi:unnamed protein product [Callosobruchus maculatus]|nr:unnamed protein product [Callosobruchus maculatus]